MDNEERALIFNAINKMIETYEKEIEHNFSIFPLLRIEVREYRSGDLTLGESIVVDQIKEIQEDNLNHNKDMPM